jgi:hypothetical protein
MAKLSEANKRAFKRVCQKFLDAMAEKVDVYLLTEDVEGLAGLVSLVKLYSGYEVLSALEAKGLSADVRALCDKAGRLKRVE